jgi:hypothetical protein
MHDGDHEIFDKQHNHEHPHKEKSNMTIKIVAGLIVIGLIIAFVAWRLT